MLKSPKPTRLTIILLFVISDLTAQNAWINEFHYDNNGGDEGEFVEVAIQDAGSYNLSFLTVTLYNGDGGLSYGSHAVDSFDEGVTENGFTIYYKSIEGIQNGAPDGFLLDYDGTLIQFISYEGVFTAAGGPADNETSEDVGVEESGSTEIGHSLQLSGNGTFYDIFTWQDPADATPGQLNIGQTLGAGCTAPTTQANFITPTAVDINDNQITLNWTSGDGDEVIILAKENNIVDKNPVNGTSYTADNDFSSSSADEIGTGNFVVYNGSGTSVDVTGLNQGTEYHFAIFEYLSVDQCYLMESETISVTTTTSFDDDSEINNPSTQIPATDISSIVNTEAEAREVFKFEVSDLGTSDGEPTLLQKILIEKSDDNTVSNWSTVIKGAKLNDGTSDLNTTHVLIAQDYIEIDLTRNEFEIADGTTESLTLSIWLEESQIDGDTIGFKISENHGFEVNLIGSSFQNSLSSSVNSEVFKIEVKATELLISDFDQEVYVNDTFALKIEAVDINGNIDLSSQNLSISSSGSGNLSGTLEIELINGSILINDLKYDYAEETSLLFNGDQLFYKMIVLFIEPIISIEQGNFNSDFASIKFPNNSSYQSYQVSGQNLKDSVKIIAPEGFKLALDPKASNAVKALILDYENLNWKEIFVRFSPTEGDNKVYRGEILHISSDADTARLEVSGKEGTLNLVPIESVRELALGKRVKIQGVVVGGINHFENRRIIQDETAGIATEGLNSSNLDFGDSVEVEGVLAEIQNWLTIIPEKEINILSTDTVLVEPLLLTLTEINQNFASKRVKIENLSIHGEGQFESGKFLLYDELDSIYLKLNSEDHPLVGTDIPFEKVNVIGFIDSIQDTFYIYPEFAKDLEIIPRDTVLNIEVPEEGLSFGNVVLDYNSDPKAYSLQAQNLAENLKLTASENFEISLLEDAHYANDLNLPINERGDIPEITVYVRFSPIMARVGGITGEILHKSGSQEFVLPLNGIEEIVTYNNASLRNQILIYPNPVSSQLAIKVEGLHKYHYELLGLDGTIFLDGKLKSEKVLNLDELPNGIYFFKIIKGIEKYFYKIIKE